ncbi:methyltransferase domain-containing protein [Candidatus Woesebacteria bacterium]|nr:methyltransferase domain-containing protein [Candidatus Woesebacteria bacterium]QQG47815.1 MAG: methyltransferase domain-containing protein [Candidatus Woesebacteria bacterium]
MNSDLKTWDAGALDYLTEASEENDVFKREVDTPAFVNMLGDVKNKSVLDIGCGNGDFVKKISKLTTKVVGLDGSPKMIEAARKNFPEGNFIVCDLMGEKIPLSDDSVDIVTSKMMLMNVESVRKVGEKVFEVLKNDGLYAIDVVHPFRPVLKNLQNSSRYNKSLNYFKETSGTIEFNGKKYSYYYRSTSQYVDETIDSGFKLLQMDELGIDENLVKKYPVLLSKLNSPISLHLLFQK